MNVLLISQCRKNALIETRRILDQFAERRGDTTWQTAITQQGLDTLYRLLRRTARKNTAVACHWIRGKDHSELLWIVGDGRQFNALGATPTNRTTRDVLREDDENDWHAAEDMRLLACLAALFHDFGKANDAFQHKLKADGGHAVADAFRHEWVSLRLFEAFVRQCGTTDRDWLSGLAELAEPTARAVIVDPQCDGQGGRRVRSPFKDLPPLAQVIGWLIVSHHRLPTQALSAADPTLKRGLLEQLLEQITHDWCGSRPGEPTAPRCWQFSHGLPINSRHWRQHAAKLARAVLLRSQWLTAGEAAKLLDRPYVLHLSRMALMLADHHYSARPSQSIYGDPPGRPRTILYANTLIGDDGRRHGKQRLDEHLIGVEVSASRIVRALPRLAGTLPRIARHKGFRERSQGLYRWQNRAFDVAEAIRERAAAQGFFGVNLASTGCGKTLANGRILYALADPQLGARFTVALGLRTLTLQTGDAYRQRLRLQPEDLAVLVGGVATRERHEYPSGKQAVSAPDSGSESASPLLPVHNYVHYEGSLESGPLKEWLGASDALRLLDAPILACTIDHLMPATEGVRGGHQIAPMLRLMTADLVLDEADDFAIEDLPALARLVHWAGLLGSRVLLSSATLPPALVQGLFQAYLAGRSEYQRHRGRPGERLAVTCAWFDEFGARASDHDDGPAYLAAHREFVDQRLSHLAAAARDEVRRRAAIQPLPIAGQRTRDEVCRDLAGELRKHLHGLHPQHCANDPRSGKRVSFGLIRMANIDPLFDVARELFRLGAAEGCRIHLCVYHSRHPLLVRAAIEKTLDTALQRKVEDAVFALGSVRERLDASVENDHLFVVLATAVAEVGRDHDYDWAIVEPSSMRSIIQLAGRVRRHRPGACPEGTPNLYLLDTNIAHLLRGDSQPAFLRPGFENTHFRLLSHHLGDLLAPAQWRAIDAAPRIKERDPLQPQNKLADLEHARLRDLLLGAEPGQIQVDPCVRDWWLTRAHLSGELQRRRPFRHDPQGRLSYALLPDDDGRISLYRLGDRGELIDVGLSARGLAREIALDCGPRIQPWAVPRYLEALSTIADDEDKEPRYCAEKYGVFDLPGRADGHLWRYHWALGFSRHSG